MLDKQGYLESLVDDDLQKFIITHLDEDPEQLLADCIDFLKKSEKNAIN